MDVPHISAHGAPNLKEQFHQIFQKYQFPLSGVVDYDLSLPLYREHASRYEEWIQNQSQCEMNYLARVLERRMNPMLVFPELKSVIVVARPYSPHPVGTSQIRYARYLNGPDYHESMKVDLECSMLEVLRQEWVPKNLKYKICVDTSAVLERTWAALAGLGWIGKNTLLIHPQFGSYLFLGVIFTNQSFGKPPTLHLDYCGNCTRCLDTCPTGAFPESHYLESKKCISYLTLEKRGPSSEPFDSKGFVAGCDICQEGARTI